MYRRTIGVLAARLELISNSELILSPRYFTPGLMESLLTDYGRIDDLAADDPPDATVFIWDEDVAPAITVAGRTVIARGPFVRLEDETADKRYTLFGNQGLVYRYLLYLLEEAHGIHSFHANALYQPEKRTLTVVLGGAATGKSPALLAGVLKGLRVFGTELVHVGLGETGPIFYRSSAIDNMRLSAVHEDFPEIVARLGVPPPGAWPQVKYPLDLGIFAAAEEALDAPRLRVILPRVEPGRARPIVEPMGRPGPLVKALFDNASEKVASSFTVYNAVAMPGFDSPRLAQRRLAAMQHLAAEATIESADTILAAPRYFLEVF